MLADGEPAGGTTTAAPSTAAPSNAAPLAATPTTPARIGTTAGGPTARAAKADPVVLGAEELARAAALNEATEPGTPGSRRVGAYLGAVMDAERVALHRFACTDAGYLGWVWTVELSRAPRAKTPTVDDVTLLPGDGALLAPAWLPYDQRVRPGDLGVGDLLPTSADDVRLVLSQADVDAVEDADLWWELGLGRPRVLSAWGREEAAERWWNGEPGPEAQIARAAIGKCGGCGFWVRLVGGLGRAFGVCANEMAPDDGSVVATAHGCGAHSETVVDTPSRWGDVEPADELEVVPTAELVADATGEAADDVLSEVPVAVAGLQPTESAEPHGD